MLPRGLDSWEKKQLPISFPWALDEGGGQAKFCGTYADLVGIKKSNMQISSMVNRGEFLMFF